MSSAALEIIANHLNAPKGAQVTAADVAELLTQGAGMLRDDDEDSHALCGLFAECNSTLIIMACDEVQVPIGQAHALYVALRALGAPPCPEWDAFIST